MITCPMTDMSTRVFRNKRNQKQFDRLSFVKSHCNTIFNLQNEAPFFNLDCRREQGTMKYKGQKFIEKEKFVPKEEIEGFQYDTLKRVFLGYHIDVPSTETKRSTQSGIFKRGIRLKQFCRVLQRSLVVLMLATTSERLRPIVPTVRGLQCICDYNCEKFMDCCALVDIGRHQIPFCRKIRF